MVRSIAAAWAALITCAGLGVVLGAGLGVNLATAPAAWAQSGSRMADALGDWSGRYVCAQGVTGLDLRVMSDGGAARALFAFYPVAQNPNVPFGCFEMRGRLVPRTNQLRLEGARWLRRPPGYVTVDLAGVVDAAAMSFSGRVSGPSCGAFELARAPAATMVDKLCAVDVSAASPP